MARIGFGAAALGDETIGDREAEALLAGVLERGIQLIDTARSYGASEERIGRFFKAHPQVRPHAVLSTKIGYGVLGLADWTGACITAGIDAALERLCTERIELVHLHSCPMEILQREEIIAPLENAVRAGKIALACYSGDGLELKYAVRCGRFHSVQASYNLTDRANGAMLSEARSRGINVIVKRALGNAPWRFPARPEAADLATYWDRWQALALDLHLPLAEVALRFAAHFEPAEAILLGTRSLAHLDAAISALAKGPLPGEVLEYLETRYSAVGSTWPAMI